LGKLTTGLKNEWLSQVKCAAGKPQQTYPSNQPAHAGRSPDCSAAASSIHSRLERRVRAMTTTMVYRLTNHHASQQRRGKRTKIKRAVVTTERLSSGQRPMGDREMPVGSSGRRE